MAYGYRGFPPKHVPRTVDTEDQNDLVFTRCLGYCASLPLEQFCRAPTLGPDPLDSISEGLSVLECAHRRHGQYAVVHGVRIPSLLPTE